MYFKYTILLILKTYFFLLFNIFNAGVLLVLLLKNVITSSTTGAKSPLFIFIYVSL